MHEGEGKGRTGKSRIKNGRGGKTRRRRMKRRDDAEQKVVDVE